MITIISCGYTPLPYSYSHVSLQDGSHFGISINGDPYWQKEFPLSLNIDEGTTKIIFPLHLQGEIRRTKNWTHFKALRHAVLKVSKTDDFTIVRINQIYFGTSQGSGIWDRFAGYRHKGENNDDRLVSELWTRRSRLGGMTYTKEFLNNANTVHNTFIKSVQGIIEENNEMGFQL